MWQIYSFGSLFSAALEETIDKANIVKNKTIGNLNATWIRNVLFLIISILGGILIEKKIPTLTLSFSIIFLGIFYGISAIFYTFLLKKIEVTSSSLMSNFLPLLFLPIDIFILNKNFNISTILGIFLLVTGGLIFFAKKGIFGNKKQKMLIFGIFIFDAILYGSEMYIFQNSYTNLKISETSFLVSVWSMAVFFLTCVIIFGNIFFKKQKLNTSTLLKYTYISIPAKVADFGNSFFFLKALSLASASQVSSMSAFYPFVLIFIVFIIQQKLKINLNEILDTKNLLRKIIAIILICIGGVLVS
jgi:drug/metabolite transporter (DMT)-like permease